MQRRNSPSILPYGLGLGLVLSPALNAFLLREQTRLRNGIEFGDVRPVNSDFDGGQRRLSAGQPADPRPDTLLAGVGKPPTHLRTAHD